MAEVLVADDDAAIRTVVSQALIREGYEVRTTSNIATLRQWTNGGAGDLVITDVAMPDGNIFDVMPALKRNRPDLPFIVMSAQNTFMTAITATEKGAYDYLPKPFDLREMIDTAARALQAPAAASGGDAESNAAMPLVGRSAAMQDIYRVIARMTQTDLTVLINGESGTGKELVARALHDFSRRSKGPFVAINMAAIPRELIESELFGHEKGAFTGAETRSEGRFEQANGGTLFLDEIGDMPMEAQTRLLRVLQEGEYTTVGGRRPIGTDVRIVAATHQNLPALIDAGQFREDLYYRLNVVPMRLPALRERAQDVPDLARHFLAQCVERGLPRKSFEQAAFDRLIAYGWPGNVRELENVVQRLVALHPQEVITAELASNELAATQLPTASNAVSGNARERLEDAVSDLTVELLAERQGSREDIHQTIIDAVEKPMIGVVLAHMRGNQIQAARRLGVNRNTLRKKVRNLSIAVMRAIG
jgi:two-component system nitrogen regulation response regulator GlnG